MKTDNNFGKCCYSHISSFTTRAAKLTMPAANWFLLLLRLRVFIRIIQTLQDGKAVRWRTWRVQSDALLYNCHYQRLRWNGSEWLILIWQRLVTDRWNNLHLQRDDRMSRRVWGKVWMCRTYHDTPSEANVKIRRQKRRLWSRQLTTQHDENNATLRGWILGTHIFHVWWRRYAEPLKVYQWQSIRW
jgi:hypothetical protein